MSKNNTKTYSLSIQEISFLNTLCKNMGYLRENVVGIHPGTYSHIKIQSDTFKNDDIDIIRKKFQTKFDKRLIFSGGTSCMYSDMKVGYLTKIDK
jgi:hypothetical protein